MFSQFCWVERALEEMEKIVHEGGGEVIGKYSCKLKANFDEFDEAMNAVM